MPKFGSIKVADNSRRVDTCADRCGCGLQPLIRRWGEHLWRDFWNSNSVISGNGCKYRIKIAVKKRGAAFQQVRKVIRKLPRLPRANAVAQCKAYGAAFFILCIFGRQHEAQGACSFMDAGKIVTPAFSKFACAKFKSSGKKCAPQRVRWLLQPAVINGAGTSVNKRVDNQHIFVTA